MSDLQALIADRVKRAQIRAYRSAVLHNHLRALAVAIPHGTRSSAIRGADTARLIASALAAAVAARARDIEGTAVELCDELLRRGWLALPRCPAPLTAGAAWAMLARLSPLVVTIRRGRYRLLLQAHRPDQVAADFLAALERRQHPADFEQADATAAAGPAGEPEIQAGSDASAAPALPSSLSALPRAEEERARAEITAETPSARCGDAGPGSTDELGATPGSSAPAAFALRFAPGRAASGSTSGWSGTRSSWLGSIPRHKHLLRAGQIALRLSPEGNRGSAAEIVERLARGTVWGSRRDRAALVRGFLALHRRGLVVLDGDRWRLPEFEQHPALVVLDVSEVPGVRGPSEDLAAMLERNGVDPRGLSHSEARSLSARLHTRRQQGRAHAGTVLRVAREMQAADLPVDLRELRRLDQAAARHALEVAMAQRIAREAPWL